MIYGKEGRDKISQFLTKTPELPEAQRDSVWAFIYLIPNIDFPDSTKELSFEKFCLYTGQSKESMAGVSMAMQSVYSAQDGYIARQVQGNNPGLANTALRWWHSGVARLEIPINTFSIDDFNMQGKAHKHARTFISEFKKQGFKDIQICDFSILIQCIAALSNIYLHLRKETNDTRPVYATYELRNVFYKLPFVDSSKFIERCSNNGIPVIQDRIIRYSETPYFDNMLPLSVPEESPETSDEYRIPFAPYLFAAPIAYHILNVTGALYDVCQIAYDQEIWGHHIVGFRGHHT